MESNEVIYLPNKGVRFLNNELYWGEHRIEVRKKTVGEFRQSDSQIDMSIYHNDSSDFNIKQQRDIYSMINGYECFVFFNYDQNDLLRDIEIHNGMSLKFDSIILSFDKNIIDLVSEIKKAFKSTPIVDSEGYFLFEELKLVIASDQSMGGDGTSLGYIYVSNNIDHLS
jgi:hypothetical protein